jgi:hypothetical protein
VKQIASEGNSREKKGDNAPSSAAAAAAAAAAAEEGSLKKSKSAANEPSSLTQPLMAGHNGSESPSPTNGKTVATHRV